MKKLALLGYGKMGQMIQSLSEKEDFVVSLIHDGGNELDLEKLKECDAAIDFSIPSAAFNNVSTCIKLNVPVVCGTTGWLDNLPEVEKLLEKHSSSAFMYGSNYSIGANIFFLTNKYLAKLMSSQSYNLELTEIHHTTKLDSPSGTAISIANDIIEHTSKENWINETSNKEEIIPIISIREPGVKGTHIVSYINEIDEINIEHKALSREGFAIGALKAANWLIGKRGNFRVQEFIKEELLRS